MQVRDAQGVEPAAIAEVADLEGARVLEVGCGDGRLTRFTAARAREVYAFDPDGDRVRTAEAALATELLKRVSFGVHDADAVTRDWAGTDLSDALAVRVGREQARVRLHQDVRLRVLRAR